MAGLIAQRAGLPAGWLVGPMLVALAVALLWEKHPTVPRWGRIASLAVVGGLRFRRLSAGAARATR